MSFGGRDKEKYLASDVGRSKSKKIKVGKEAPAPL